MCVITSFIAKNGGSACPRELAFEFLEFRIGTYLPATLEAVEGAASYACQEKDTNARQSLCEPHRP
jgi:hypothetical protein